MDMPLNISKQDIVDNLNWYSVGNAFQNSKCVWYTLGKQCKGFIFGCVLKLLYTQFDLQIWFDSKTTATPLKTAKNHVS